MRFFENSPQIPDELLFDCDNDNVIFFCGAGVSQEKAGLPNFVELADRVCQNLGAQEDSQAKKGLEKVKDPSNEGLISLDKIFSFLEKEFSTGQLHSAISQILKPSQNADFSAHEIMLRLSKQTDGKTKLVTTNFDRLFECGQEKNIELIEPSQLHNPNFIVDFDGVAHIHGLLNKEYNAPESSGLILTETDFGKAYLSEGWATKFFLDLVKFKTIVFVGYSADDPPIRYLLNAIGGVKDISKIYSFVENSKQEYWQNLDAVTPIFYQSSEQDHTILWKTLSAWATRRDNRDAWYQSVLQKAKAGPENLKPFERGQMAHLIKTTHGAKLLLESDCPPEWVRVFDKGIRFQVKWYLDDDKISAHDFQTQEVHARGIEGEWHWFDIKELDEKEIGPHHVATPVNNSGFLLQRFHHLTSWIAKNAHSQIMIQWAAWQPNLHPDLKTKINNNLEQNPSEFRRD